MLKIVVVDNNAISRDLLGTILLNGGHDVIGGTNNAPAGLARAIKMRPQVVCIDIGSEPDNLQMLDTLREALPKALLFLVSGALSPESVQAALARGVHGFIVKPFNAQNVLTTIRNTIIRVARQHKATRDETAAESGAAPGAGEPAS